MNVEILEVDQWTSTGNVTDYCLDDFKRSDIIVTGGDAQAARVIFGGRAKIRVVNENDRPFLGSVWYKEDPETGKLKIWKARYDSS